MTLSLPNISENDPKAKDNAVVYEVFRKWHDSLRSLRRCPEDLTHLEEILLLENMEVGRSRFSDLLASLGVSKMLIKCKSSTVLDLLQVSFLSQDEEYELESRETRVAISGLRQKWFQVIFSRAFSYSFTLVID